MAAAISPLKDRAAQGLHGCLICRGIAAGNATYGELASSLDLGHDPVGHRAYKLLASHLVTVPRLRLMGDEDLRQMRGFGPGCIERVRAVLPEPTRAGNRCTSSRLLHEAARYTPAAFPTAPLAVVHTLIEALREAAAEYDYAARINAREPGGLEELPSPSAEGLLAFARALLSGEAPRT